MVTLEEARRRQNTLHAEGEELKKILKIEEHLAKIGTINHEGSFDYGLMVKPDIDYSVAVEKPNIQAVAIFAAELMVHPLVKKVLVGNHFDFYDKRPGIPKGIYIGVDPVFVKRESDPQDQVRQASPKQKDTILVLKHNLFEQKKYPGTGEGMFASADIYRAVLNDGVETLKELSAWRKTHPFH